MFGSLIPKRERSMLPSNTRFGGMFQQMDSEMQDLMERFWGTDGGWLAPTLNFVPQVDLSETEEAFEVKADLPGLKPEEVSVELKNGALWISGEKKEEKEEKQGTYHRLERRHGQFRRILPLPETVEEEKIEATFHDGVLSILVPKSPQAKPKKIEVKA